MEMSGRYRIPAPRDKVWAALNDPVVLKESIPGCQSLEKISDTEMAATVKPKVGPVAATFTGSVTLTNIDPPNGYTITGEGKGGVAGFAKGGADVALADDDGMTLLTYTAKGQVGGKLAQIGARLIDATAKQMADQFFAAFADKVGGEDAFAQVEHESRRRVKSRRGAQAEEAAVRSFLGGPQMWALIALAVAHRHHSDLFPLRETASVRR